MRYSGSGWTNAQIRAGAAGGGNIIGLLCVILLGGVVFGCIAVMLLGCAAELPDAAPNITFDPERGIVRETPEAAPKWNNQRSEECEETCTLEGSWADGLRDTSPLPNDDHETIMAIGKWLVREYDAVIKATWDGDTGLVIQTAQGSYRATYQDGWIITYRG